MSICVIPATVGQIYSSKLLGLEKSKTLIIGRIISVTSFLTAILFLGLIGEYVGKVLKNVNKENQYIVSFVKKREKQ